VVIIGNKSLYNANTLWDKRTVFTRSAITPPKVNRLFNAAVLPSAILFHYTGSEFPVQFTKVSPPIFIADGATLSEPELSQGG